jgi:hypothetical protein
MKQAYFFAQLPGSSLADPMPSEWRVRAASAGLTAERLQALLPVGAFQPPLGDDGQPLTPAPERLALLQTNDLGRILCRSVLCPADAHHPGPYAFTHVIVDLPPTADAHQAIQTWRSDQWQSSDPGPTAELPDAWYLPVAAHLDDAGLKSFLEQPNRRDLFTFVLAAMLTSEPDGRIFLAAAAEDVARCVHGLTRALPLILLEGFTFSTYESDPVTSAARLVGTTWNPQLNRDLPPVCYDAIGVAYNTFTETKTGLNTELPFVKFAVDALATGSVAALDEFRLTWQRLGVKNPGLLDLVFRLERGLGGLTKEDARTALADPALAAWMAQRTDVVGQLLDWAIDDVDFATGTFSRVVGPLRQKPATLDELANTLNQRGMAALQSGEVSKARTTLEVLLPMVNPARAATLWADVIQKIGAPEDLPWETRVYLLPRVARLKPLTLGHLPDAAGTRWLQVPEEKLESLLALDLPQAHQVAAILLALNNPKGSLDAVAQALAKYPAMLLVVMPLLGAQPEGERQAAQLFEKVTALRSDRPWADDLLRQGRGFTRALLDQCLSTALRTGTVDHRQLVRDHAAVLTEHLANQPSLDAVATALLAQSGQELLAEAPLVEFLQTLSGQTGLSEATRLRLESALHIHRFLKEPQLEREPLAQAASAFNFDPPLFGEATLKNLVSTIARALVKSTDGVQAKLENSLVALGGKFTGGPNALYRELLNQVQETGAIQRDQGTLLAFLALSLDAADTPLVNEQLEGLDAEAFSLVRLAHKIGGTKYLDELEARQTNWPRAGRREWTFLRQAVRPTGFHGVARDLTVALVTLALCVAAVAALKWLHIL